MSEKKFNRYKYLLSSAKYRKIEVDLTVYEYNFLLKKGCAYCGVCVLETRGCALDRVDSNKGYFFTNCFACCKICNIAKNSLTQREFFLWVNRIYHHLDNQIKGKTNNLNFYEPGEWKQATDDFQNTKQNKKSKRIKLKFSWTGAPIDESTI